MEYKTVPFSIKATADSSSDVLRFSGLGAAFGNVDSYGDVIERGAFAESISRKRPKMLMHHGFGEHSITPVGSWTELQETDDGLAVKGELFLETDPLRLVGRAMRAGELDGLSIGYIPTVVEAKGDDQRVLKRIDLWEISIVTWPANQEATVTAIKAALAAGKLPSKRNLEAILRDVGLSALQAKRLLASGYDGMSQRDVGEAVSTETIHNLLEVLRQ